MHFKSITIASTLLLILAAFVSLAQAQAAEPHPEQHPARGIVLSVSKSHRELSVSCDEVPGYMAAMEMSFTVHDPNSLKTLKPGTAITFIIVPKGKALYAEFIHPTPTQSFESEPMEAGSLTALHSILQPTEAGREVAPGQPVPDFTLTDQTGNKITLSQFRGKVVALTFGYSRCPNPNYCLRLSNNLAHLAKHFPTQAGQQLVLLTIAIDPEHDQGEALSQYAASFHADPKVWHFLTGPLPEIRQVASCFGTNFWSSEGLLTHTLHTAILDRQGRLITNLEGNHFTQAQLADLVATAIKSPSD